MSLDRQAVEEAAGLLKKFLGPELSEIVQAVSQDPGPNNPYFIELPKASSVDFTAEELASLVARTSNAYGRAARFAGLAKAEFKLAEGRYKQKFKTSLAGKNQAEREANAMSAATDEYIVLTTIEAIMELAESMESAARIASESARKLFSTVDNMNIAQAREQKGHFKDTDFNSDF